MSQAAVLPFAPSSADVAPPSNIEAEESVLGGILLDPGALARVRHHLPADAFYIAAHRGIYRACCDVADAGHVPDLMTVSARLHDSGDLERIGGQLKLAQLLERTITAANIDQHAQLLLGKYQRRRLADLGAQLQLLAVTHGKSIAVCLGEAEAGYRDLLQLTSSDEFIAPLSDLVAEVMCRAETMQADGLATGFYDLDAMTGGLHRSDLVIVAGRPAMGKTSMAIQMAQQVASAHRKPVLLVSLEMSAQQLAGRILSGAASIEAGRLRGGRIAQHEWEPIGHHVSRLSQVPVWISDRAQQSVAEISAHAQRIIAEQGDLACIVVDYIQLMGDGSPNRVQELSAITRGLKITARELNTTVIGLSQLSRNVESRHNKRPLMSDLRESGSLEQDADLVMMLYREEYYEPETPDRGIAEVILAKHRNGPTGTVKLLFDARFTRFRNIAKGPE